MRDFIDKEKRSTIMETSKIERLRDMKKNEEKQQETAKEKMSRKKLLCVIGIPVGILVVIYLVLALFFQSHFAFRTTINMWGYPLPQPVVWKRRSRSRHPGMR